MIWLLFLNSINYWKQFDLAHYSIEAFALSKRDTLFSLKIFSNNFRSDVAVNDSKAESKRRSLISKKIFENNLHSDIAASGWLICGAIWEAHYQSNEEPQKQQL